ncbi:MAG: YggT family protein [Alteromonadaceae bacterium]|jgi:YggT family protein
MNSMSFLINTLFDLYLMVVLLRLWLQWAKADFYNPFSQFVTKATNPLLRPLRRIVPGWGGFDFASLVLALLVAAAKVVTLQLVVHGGISLPTVAINTVLTVFKEAFSLVFWVLIFRAILSWVSQGQNPIEAVLHQLTEPMLAPLRKVLPPMGGFDLSIMVLLLGLQFLQILMGDVLGLLL